MNSYTLISNWLVKLKRYEYPGFLLLGFLFALGVWLTFIPTQLGKKTALSHYYASLEDFKLEKLQKFTSKPKILIFAGSNVDYGIRTTDIQKATGIPTFNLGLIASFKISYLTYLVKQHVRPGDIVIFPLEYHYYVWDNDNVFDTVEYIASSRPDFIQTLNPWDRFKFLLTISSLNLIKSYDYSQSSSSRDRYSPNFNTQARNENGDYLLNTLEKMTPLQHDTINRLKPFSFLQHFPNGFGEKSVIRAEIPGFIQWCHRHNIRFIATYPSFIYFENNRSPQEKQFYDSIQQFYQQQGVPILGNAFEFMYDRSLFFDTRYHLNAKGAALRTQKIIALLKQELKAHPLSSPSVYR